MFLALYAYNSRHYIVSQVKKKKQTTLNKNSSTDFFSSKIKNERKNETIRRTASCYKNSNQVNKAECFLRNL